MANASQIMPVIMALLRRSGKLPDNVGKPKGAAAKSPTPEIDAEPSTYDAATDELIMGLPEKKAYWTTTSF